jgi:hypothetical protein
MSNHLGAVVNSTLRADAVPHGLESVRFQKIVTFLYELVWR